MEMTADIYIKDGKKIMQPYYEFNEKEKLKIVLFLANMAFPEDRQNNEDLIEIMMRADNLMLLFNEHKDYSYMDKFCYINNEVQ